MKTIIDIPDSFRNSLLEGSLTNDQILEVYRAARRGLILPKCHGRLIDADELDVTTVETDDYSGNEVLDVVLKDDIDNAPTIIEADTESEE